VEKLRRQVGCQTWRSSGIDRVEHGRRSGDIVLVFFWSGWIYGRYFWRLGSMGTAPASSVPPQTQVHATALLRSRWTICDTCRERFPGPTLMFKGVARQLTRMDSVQARERDLLEDEEE
jgi:hypothetical protein